VIISGSGNSVTSVTSVSTVAVLPAVAGGRWQSPREPEIGDLAQALLVQQQVARLQVPVQHARRVHVLDGFQQPGGVAVATVAVDGWQWQWQCGSGYSGSVAVRQVKK
jgi:hypothetical protein